jgi:hypothetical protein
VNNFTEDFLRNIANNNPEGDFSPFNKKDISKNKRYLKGMIGMLSEKKSILIDADYASYGSGFASYINIKISKKDKSDVTTIKDNNRTIDEHDGLLIYVSLVAPYWYYGKGNWWDNYSDGSYTGGGGNFLMPDSIKATNMEIWQNEIDHITKLFDDYRIRLLTMTEVELPLWFEVEMKSNLAGRHLTVFDCFFHWDD